MEVAPIAAVSVRSIGAVQERSALAPGMEVTRIGGERSAEPRPVSRTTTTVRNQRARPERAGARAQHRTVRDEPPRQLAPMAVAPISEISTQSIAIVDEVPAPVAPTTACEQIWDQMTHMSRDEWAEACRRVDELRLVVRN